MGITLEQAKALERGDVLHSELYRNRDGTCQRWKVCGKVKTWKKRPWKVRVPVKHGLRSYDYLEEGYLGIVHLERECPHCR